MSWNLLPFLLQGAVQTLWISVLAIAMGLLAGVLVAAARLSGKAWLSIPATGFVSFFRGVPLLVQLLLIYNALPLLGIGISSVGAAMMGLALCTAAYQAENLRGGFNAISPGLLEAAEMMGFTPWQRLWRIRVPIALRMTLPAIVNEATMILKASSLVSVVGVVELTRVAQDVAASTFEPIPVFACAGLMYLLMTGGLVFLGRSLERRLSWSDQ